MYRFKASTSASLRSRANVKAGFRVSIMYRVRWGVATRDWFELNLH
jgi:hypothetical protein